MSVLERTDLRSAIADAAATKLGGRVSVAAIEHTRTGFRTLFPVEVIEVTLAGGERLELFLKWFGSQQADHPDKQRRDREINVYLELLKDEGLPVAACYGTGWDAESEQSWLLLEHVPAWPLKYQGLDEWFVAARRLAHLHAHFASQTGRLVEADFLLRLDAEYLASWAGRAAAAVGERYSIRLARRVDAVVEESTAMIGRIASQPLTLVHNDLGSKNVIAETSVQPARIAFVDWELAGIGCALMDLVHLRYARLDAASDRRMVDEYRAAVSGSGLVPESDDEFRLLFAACELHRTLYRLSHCGVWGKSPEYVEERVAYAERLGRTPEGITE